MELADVRSVGIMVAVVAATIAAPATAAIDLARAPAGMVVRSADAACDGSAYAGAGAVAVCQGGASTDFDLMFVDPGNPARKGSTSSFSIDVDAGSKAMLTAYDESGRLLGVADRSTVDGMGERLTLTGLGDIARIHVSGRGPIAVADLSFADVKTGSRLPEPATWAMLMIGFGATAALIRRRIRLSEARFTERMRRIAAGEAG
ncbi:PEPxxWA-CTERM sorting domain-containing protein [Sphingomonas sp. KR1UV-12]|uniref:PEPxxWA-CTERM sorting domain-containing protein n=1 Tax=Sphingomonas aurea TaxID=3063994 RepID=A0ABT9EFY9_9SPHN|nr:PEPxxWA-CTERM sorting domain-containing protein [Sphingomonas sp. KR1UV-12]MDP1025886.1 PEPxxWA-CTERM sorting domain-containing protein [Sphingomonas sp. KR1UV-12]